MNIILIGSCNDSSYLAKELNKRLNDSIVARIDLLKQVKQLVLSGLDVKTVENIGTYIGDVETFDTSKLTPVQKEEVSTKVKTILTLTKSNSRLTFNTFDALTSSLTGGLYSFIKIYSGIVDDSSFTTLQIPYGECIVINVKKTNNPIIPISIKPETLEQLKTSAFSYVECDEVEKVFQSEVFELLINNGEHNTEKKVKKLKDKAVKPVYNETFTIQDVEEVLANAA